MKQDVAKPYQIFVIIFNASLINTACPSLVLTLALIQPIAMPLV
jgi:hypothetical protein